MQCSTFCLSNSPSFGTQLVTSRCHTATLLHCTGHYYIIALYGTLLHHCTVRCTATLLHCTVHCYITALYGALLYYCAVQCSTILLHCMVQCNQPDCQLHCNTLRCTALHCTELKCTAVKLDTLPYSVSQCSVMPGFTLTPWHPVTFGIKENISKQSLGEVLLKRGRASPTQV